MPLSGHFESPISTDLLPYGMSLYLAIFSPNMKTMTYFVAGSHLEFPIFTKFLPRHPLTYTNPYAKFQKNPSTFATCRARTIKVYERGKVTTTKP